MANSKEFSHVSDVAYQQTYDKGVNYLDLLQNAGYKLQKDYSWVRPEGHKPTSAELTAIYNLQKEHNFGNLIPLKPKPVKPSTAPVSLTTMAKQHGIDTQAVLTYMDKKLASVTKKVKG